MRKFWLGLVLVGLVFGGCVSTGTYTPNDADMDHRFAALEERVSDLEQQALMGMAGRIAGDFFPFSVDLTGGDTGDIA